jgi:hypothetical protein
MDWQVDLASTTEVFDVTVSTMFRAAFSSISTAISSISLSLNPTGKRGAQGFAFPQDVPGIVLAPSRAIFSLISPEALPACAFLVLGGWATILSNLFAAMSSPSRLFHVAKTFQWHVSHYQLVTVPKDSPLLKVHNQ